MKLKTKKHIRDTNRHAKFGKDRFTGGVWATTQISAVHSGLAYPFYSVSFVHFAQRPGRTARRTATIEGSDGVIPAKEVPFWCLNNER